ncbi:MAG: F0F1 ATP synthase subunit A, partial [Bacteroidota bacterium]
MSKAQDSGAPAGGEPQSKEAVKLNPSKIILEHVGDAHEFHFFSINGKPVTLSLPVILYSPAKGGWSVFMSSQFEHGAKIYGGYQLLEDEYVEEHKLDPKVYQPGKIFALNEAGIPDASIKVYDLSLGRNAV